MNEASFNTHTIIFIFCTVIFIHYNGSKYFDLIENLYVIFPEMRAQVPPGYCFISQKDHMLIPFTNYYHFIRHKTLSMEKLILRLGIPM